MSDVLREALRLRAMGFAVHWLQPNSKAPLLAGWSTAPVMSAAELESSYRAGHNIGFRAGRFSVVGEREALVLDVDIKDSNYADEAYAAAQAIMAGSFRPHVRSGSGPGRHQFLGAPIGTAPNKAAVQLRRSDVFVLDGHPCDPHVDGAKPAWAIELLSSGKNVVLPPSIHPVTGYRYEWLRRPE